jgi:hypothetical protein
MKLVLIYVILIMIGVFYYNHLYAQESSPEDFAPPIDPPDFPDIAPPDFNSPDDNFWSNTKLIAQDIALYNQTEIKDYPITDLTSAEIKSVFMILDSGNITKVLLNIPVNDINEIQNKLSEEEFNSILNRIPLENQNALKERINKN